MDHTHTLLHASPNVPSVHALLGLMSAGKYTCTVVIPLDFFQQALLINEGCNVHLYNKKGYRTIVKIGMVDVCSFCFLHVLLSQLYQQV